MKSIDEAIGTTRPYVMETHEAAAARMADELLEGLNDEQIPKFIHAYLGLYLTGKAIRLNSLRNRSITTRTDVMSLYKTILAPLDYVKLPECVEEKTKVLQDMIGAAIEFRFIGSIEGMLMLTGTGLWVLETVMKKEAAYS